MIRKLNNIENDFQSIVSLNSIDNQPQMEMAAFVWLEDNYAHEAGPYTENINTVSKLTPSQQQCLPDIFRMLLILSSWILYKPTNHLVSWLNSEPTILFGYIRNILHAHFAYNSVEATRKTLPFSHYRSCLMLCSPVLHQEQGTFICNWYVLYL